MGRRGRMGGIMCSSGLLFRRVARGIVHRAFTGLVDAGGCRMRWIEGAGMVVERVMG